MYNFSSGDRVHWLDGGRHGLRCTGTIVNEERYPNGTNPFGYWSIRVDQDCWSRACHTAREMSSGMVCRSVVFNHLKPLEVA